MISIFFRNFPTLYGSASEPVIIQLYQDISSLCGVPVDHIKIYVDNGPLLSFIPTRKRLLTYEVHCDIEIPLGYSLATKSDIGKAMQKFLDELQEERQTRVRFREYISGRSIMVNDRFVTHQWDSQPTHVPEEYSPDPDFLTTNFSNLGLKRQIVNALRKFGIRTPQELLQVYQKDGGIFAPNIGPIRSQNLVDLFAKHGIVLRSWYD